MEDRTYDADIDMEIRLGLLDGLLDQSELVTVCSIRSDAGRDCGRGNVSCGSSHWAKLGRTLAHELNVLYDFVECVSTRKKDCIEVSAGRDKVRHTMPGSLLHAQRCSLGSESYM